MIIQASAGAQIRRRAVPAPPDSGGSGRVSAHPGGDAPGPRHQPGNLPTRDPARFQLGDDGRLAGRRRQNPDRLRLQRPASRKTWWRWHIPAAYRWKVKSAAWARWKPARLAKRTASVQKALDHSQLLTDPEEAARFVKDTSVDALAIAIGTSHGAYKFTRPPPAIFLASAASGNPCTHPQHPSRDARLVAAAGRLENHQRERWRHQSETYGVPVEEIVEAIKCTACARSISIPTASGLDWCNPPLRQQPRTNSIRAVDESRPAMPPRQSANALTNFGTAGQASKISQRFAGKMSDKYAKGELAQVVN